MAGKNMKKKIITFAAFMLLCALLGGVIGFIAGSAKDKDYIDKIVNAVRANGLMPSAVIFAAVNVLFGIISLAKYNSAKKKLSHISSDDDNEYIAVENSLNMPTLLSGILTIFDVTMLPVILYFTGYSSLTDKIKVTFIIIITVIYTVFIIFSFLLNRGIVELIKKMNPEKKGDLFDMDFLKKWENSCDEAQKLTIYKAAYKSFNCVKYTCIVLWVICLISQFVFNTGIFPGICVGIIFTASTIAYSMEVIRLEKQ